MSLPASLATNKKKGKMANFISTQKDFKGVLTQSDDQAIVRYLLLRHVPQEVKDKIIQEYNSHVLGINDLRLQNERARPSLRRDWP